MPRMLINPRIRVINRRTRAIPVRGQTGGAGSMSNLLGRLLHDMDEAGSAVLVMSPHLDDAVWSCGALLAHLAPRHRITVVTAFTAASPPPWSLPARRHLRAV